MNAATLIALSIAALISVLTGVAVAQSISEVASKTSRGEIARKWATLDGKAGLIAGALIFSVIYLTIVALAVVLEIYMTKNFPTVSIVFFLLGIVWEWWPLSKH